MSNKKYTQEDQLQFLEVLQKKLGIVGKALSYLKINKVIYDQWIEEYPAFKEAVDVIKGGVIDNVEEFALKHAMKNLNMAKYILNNHPEARKRGYGKKVSVDGDIKHSWADIVIEADELEG